MPRRIEAAIAARASVRYGVITRGELLQLGLSARAINHRIAIGALEVVHPGVYRIAGVPRSWEQALLAAQLAAGDRCAASHLSAAAFHSFDGISAKRPDVLIPHARRVRLRRVNVHRTRVLPPCDLVFVRGLWVTAPARTLVDCAGLVRPIRLEIAFDDAWRRQIVTPLEVRACLDTRGPNGVRGWRILDAFVCERLGTRPTGSKEETTFRRRMFERGLPMPVKQYTIRDDRDRFVAAADFAYPDIRLAIEVDGSQHGYPIQRRPDLKRHNKLTLVRWRAVHFPADVSGQDDALDTIEAALAMFGEPQRR